MVDINKESLFHDNNSTNPSSAVANSAPQSLSSQEMSQTEKEAILRQIHPIFLTTHTEEKAPVQQSNFDKFLGFLRLCLEGFLKLVDIIVDAAIQVARLFVWIIAISGVLIIVTLMTGTTDKFIDLLNVSVFRYFGIEKKIEKVTPSDNSQTEAKKTTASNVTDSTGSTNETPTTSTRKRVPSIDTTNVQQ